MPSDKYRNQSQFTESSNYETILHTSIFYQIVEIFVGIPFALYGIYIFKNTIHKLAIVVFCLILVIIGAYLLIDGLRKLFDRNPKIKFGKQGMWTEKYGLRSWETIGKTKIEYVGKVFTLKIFLNGNTTNSPNEEIILNGIVDRSSIEGLLHKYLDKK